MMGATARSLGWLERGVPRRLLALVATLTAAVLAARADVVVENFSPGTADRLGIGYREVKAHNPDVVYCSISSYGVTDPRVSHFWDEQKLVGNWYSSNVLHREGTTWDFYALYGPDGTWGSEPPRAVSQGGTIITRHDQLQAAISPLLHAGT